MCGWRERRLFQSLSILERYAGQQEEENVDLGRSATRPFEGFVAKRKQRQKCKQTTIPSPLVTNKPVAQGEERRATEC